MSAPDDMNSIREPPELSRSVVLMKVEDLSDEKVAPRPWESVQRPVDIVLITVKECEFLACLSLLNDGLYKSYHKTLGQVYFSTFGEGERRPKVAVIICGPQGSVILVMKAVKMLRPKAVLNVGYCGGLNKEKVKLGDVVVSSKLITYAATRVTEEGIKELGHVVLLSSQLANLAATIDYGWKAPLTNPEELQVKIRKDGVMLSGPEVVDSKERNQQLLERFPQAIAIEMDGEGLYAAAHDLEVEWIVIKGVSDFADGTKTSTKSWQQFASVMAASLTAHILREPYVWDDWQHYEVLAPSQILTRGPEAIEAYNRALIDGDGFVKRVPIMIIGQDRTGKTSLLKSLKGLSFDANERSTEGIEIHPSHFKVSKEIWEAGKEGKDTDDESKVVFEQLAAQLTCQTLKKEEEKESSGQEQSIQVPGKPSTIPMKTAEKQTEGESESSMDELDTDPPHFEKGGGLSEETAKEGGPSLFVPELPENIADLVEKLLQNDENVDDDNKIYSVVWDFGGQSVYYATHPIFLTERAIYILASDLSRSPFEKDKAPSRKGMYKGIEDVDCCNTNLDYLDFWMSSVYSLTSSSAIRQDAIVSDSKNSPPVFLVFTHADEPYCEKDPRELALEVYGILRDQSKIYRGHLFKDVFVVDNTKSGSDSECQEVVRLREDILTVAKNLPQMKERIPLKWLRYENILQLLNKVGYKWIPVEKARQVAMEKCGIDDSKQFQTLLNFLHDQKMLIHFNETPELDNIVILDQQWLVDIFKRVITIPRYEPSEDCVEELWRNLEKTGILDERLLEHAWKPLVDGQETFNSLIAIMERFSLLCPWPSNDTNKQYLVPSMLMSPASDDVLELLASVQIPSLFVRFGSGRVPAGLFPRLVLQFHQRCKEEWKSPVNPELFHNFALFHIRPDQGTSVIWLCHSSFIEVAICTANDNSGTVKDFSNCNFDSTTGHSINMQLRSILECMREEFHWLKTMRYEMCVCCPVCSQKGSPKCRSHDVRGCGCLHLLSESDLEERQFCTRPGVRGDIRIDINMFTSWFEFSNVRKRFSSLQPQDASGGVLDERTNKSSRKASSYIDDRGNNKRDTKKKDDKERMDDGDGDNASEEISEGGEQLPRKQHQIEEEAKKTRVHEGTVTSEGTHWDLKLGAVHLTFPPAAVTEPTSIVVHKWKSSVCSPQLQEHEAIVSNVIEISTTTNEALQFKVGVKLFFSHCAPDLQGYELVIKRLINKETNDWKEVEGTVDARQLSDIEDEYPKEVPDFSFPVVQADIAECSIFTVVCRLIPSPTYTISSRGGCFNHPDYPGVAVTVPKKAVSVKSKFLLQLKVQEVPNDEFKDGNVYVGPILRISCTQGIEFLKPVTIQLPVAPRVKGGTIPDPSICRIRVLFLRSDGENKKLVDITDDLENPARFDGTCVTFQVKRFCVYGPILVYPLTIEPDDPSFYLPYIQYQPVMANFFAHFRPSDRIDTQDILHFICCPTHFSCQVTQDLKEAGISLSEVFEISSNRVMTPWHDKAFVFVSGAISPVNEEYRGEVFLMLDPSGPHKKQLPICLIRDQPYCLVEFRDGFAHLQFGLPSRQMQGEASPGFRDSKEVSSDAVLWLSGMIGRWELLAFRLGFEPGELYGFKTDNHGDNSAQARSMLFRWKEKNGQGATLQVLCEALRDSNVGRKDLAEMMEQGDWKKL